jgi:hypothetical protein
LICRPETVPLFELDQNAPHSELQMDLSTV